MRPRALLSLLPRRLPSHLAHNGPKHVIAHSMHHRVALVSSNYVLQVLSLQQFLEFYVYLGLIAL